MSNSEVVISVENLWKEYRYGTISHATLKKDLQSWWARLRGKEDPNLRIGYEQSAMSKAHNSMPSAPSSKPQAPNSMPSAPNAMPSALSAEPDGSDRFWALHDISFEVKRGEVLGIIGKNGAGKSTLLKIMSRVTTPTKGNIKLKGRVASLLEVGTGFHPELTGRENIFLNGAILGMSKNEINRKFDEIIAFAEIEKFIDTPVKRYSSGMYVRLAFAVAAHLEPEILLVDEVLAVGDIEFRKKCLGKMGEVATKGRTVLFVSHNMSAISHLTERSLVFKDGILSYIGPTDRAIQQYISIKKQVALKGRKNIDEIEFDNQWLCNTALKIKELGLPEDQKDEIYIGGVFKLQILLEAQRDFKDIRIAYSVNDALGSSILSGFSPPFCISSKGFQLCELVINNLYLAPGSYSLSISVGIGGLYESKYEFHTLINFAQINVKPQCQNSKSINDWNKTWGQIVHTNSEVIIKDKTKHIDSLQK